MFEEKGLPSPKTEFSKNTVLQKYSQMGTQPENDKLLQNPCYDVVT
jgi:hypothetical protein